MSSLGFGLLAACGPATEGSKASWRGAVAEREVEIDARDVPEEASEAERAEQGEPFQPDTPPKLLQLLAQVSAQAPQQFVLPQANPAQLPQQVAAIGGKLREVDVVHVGGEGGAKPPLLVTVVGTGAAGILSSFRSPTVGAVPMHLYDSPRFLGHDHRLHVLTPPSQAKAAYQLLLSGHLQQGVLWLTSWRVQSDGKLVRLHTMGYGSSVGFDVERYAVEHRLVPGGGAQRFQVVTPILHDGGQQRLVSWEVDGATGQITGKFHGAGSGPRARDDSDLSVSLNTGTATVAPHFVVTSRTATQGRLNQTLWRVSGSGVPAQLSSLSSGRNIQNTANMSLPIQNALTVALNQTGHVTASVSSGQLRLDTWEDSTCIDDTCQWGSLNISNSTRDVAPNVPGVQQAGAPNPVTQNVLLRDPLTGIDMFSRNPDVVQAIASVRKVMVTLVTLDAVRDGEVDLDDIVTVSAAAANVNGSGASSMGLLEGEKISLRDLLYGNMMVSAGDATWAISEHVAGNLSNMVTRMNNKAFALNLSNTFHCQRGAVFSGVSYSSARDQMTLWQTAYQDELFLELAGRGQRDVCGSVDGEELCHAANQPGFAPPMTNPPLGNYPNIDGYKTGGGGGKCDDLPQYASTPSCASGGCLAVQTTRIGRSLLLLELQPDTAAGQNDWNDMANLSDFGFRQLFTPEARGDSDSQAGSASDFGLDAVGEYHAVSAALTGGQSFQLCNWSVDIQAGDLQKTQCLSLKVAGLASSSRVLLPARLDAARLSTLYADADYLVGHLDDSALQLSLWRVGQRN